VISIEITHGRSETERRIGRLPVVRHLAPVLAVDARRREDNTR